MRHEVPGPHVYHNHPTNNDRWIVHLFGGKRGGFFIEAGAMDGISGSCTYALERHFDWRGIVVEPGAPFAALSANRPRSSCEHACLCGHDGIVRFWEANDPGLSGITSALRRDEQAHLQRWGRARDEWRRAGGTERESAAITFRTLLRRHGAPSRIDYVALDMEGSEREALLHFPFESHEVAAFSIEGDGCDDLLEARGYRMASNPFNDTAPWERYYVKADLL